jgi:lactate dehydrogenase-like 2-hydroxyacid dehydrogenase
MKVIAYSVRTFEKEHLAKANQKKHDITLISNSLSPETAQYAAGKDAVLVFTPDNVSAGVIEQLADMGIRYIATRSAGTDHIDRAAAAAHGIKLANVPFLAAQAIIKATATVALYKETEVGNSSDQTDSTGEDLQQIADRTIKNLDLWQQDKCVGKACVCAKNCRAAEETAIPLNLL